MPCSVADDCVLRNSLAFPRARELRGKRALLKKELITLSVGKWREDELKDILADFSVTDWNPQLIGIMPRVKPNLPS